MLFGLTKIHSHFMTWFYAWADCMTSLPSLLWINSILHMQTLLFKDIAQNGNLNVQITKFASAFLCVCFCFCFCFWLFRKSGDVWDFPSVLVWVLTRGAAIMINVIECVSKLLFLHKYLHINHWHDLWVHAPICLKPIRICLEHWNHCRRRTTMKFSIGSFRLSVHPSINPSVRPLNWLSCFVFDFLKLSSFICTTTMT